ncbi:MAG: hypothetical protein KJO76_04995, partial [Gammaproteobacteria bacterium]|nr:hypothetical protein [Gammaproteobacteria bacterium]
MTELKELLRPARDAENSVRADVTPNQASSPEPVDAASLGHAELAPRPTTIEQTGLSMNLLADVTVKHLFNGGVLTIADLTERTALSGPVIEAVLNFLRKEASVEVLGSDKKLSSNDGSATNLRYTLTDRGQRAAHDALSRSGYIGAAPVPLEKYIEITNAQS